MKILQKLRLRIRRITEHNKKILANSHKEIMETNLYVLQRVSFVTIALLVMISAMTPLFFRNWTMSEAYVLLFPAMLIFLAFGFFYGKKENKSYRVVQSVCLLFCIVLFCFIIVIDTLVAWRGPSSFFGLIVVVIPIIFVFEPKKIYPVIFIAVVVYIAIVQHIKTGLIASADTFNAIVAFLFSIVTGFVVMRIRMEDKNAKLKYKQMSTIDALTGVLNKMSCEKSIIEYLKCRETSVGCGLIVMDIDNFKRINDELGHQTGDDVLEKMGLILSHNFRATDIVGRIGGDEFMILARNIQDYESLEKKCSQLQKQIQEHMESILPWQISVSLGIVILPKEYVSFEKAFQMADDALYEAKSFGKGRYVLQIMQMEVQERKHKSVMIVADDNEADRKILESVFQKEYHIVEASDGTETLSVLSQYREEIAIMILDIEMPGMDGYQVLKYMKERNIFNNIPVIVMTAEQAYEERALELGAKDVIIKPIDIEVAKLRVRNVARDL